MVVVFGGAFGLFMFLLVRQMRVRDSKWYWKRLKIAGVSAIMKKPSLAAPKQIAALTTVEARYGAT